ncbi:MAG: SulP family inorganic anion transporter [Chloroflexales bacterium]|nr:SulP family inorganic anion transporter [Chloroflexales bacterium]
MAATSVSAPRPQRKLRLLEGVRGVPAGDLPREIIAGITLAALMIPLNIGYAQVAGLPAIVGLYAAIVPMIVWPLFCTSRHLVASPDAPIAALIGALLVGLAVPGDPRYVQLAFAQSLVCALIFFLFWLFRLGFLANFLSKAVLVGFISGLGVEVFSSQLKKIMGVSVEAEGFFRELLALVAAIPRANLYAVALGVGAIVIIRLLKRFAPKLPGALIALILLTALVALFGLDQRGVSVLGAVPSGLPSLVFPQIGLGDWIALIPGALAIVGVTMAEGLLIARKYAQKYGENLDADQELFAFGAANVAAGLTGAFAVGSSASRTAAMDTQGARSQIPSLVAGVAVAVVLLFFADLLALLPNAVLGGIVANAVLSLIEVGELRELYRVRRDEFWIAIVALLSVLVLGALQAVIIAFLLSTIDVVRRAAAPRTTVLTPLPGGRGFTASAGPSLGVTVPGLIVYRFGAPLYFANANIFQEQVKQLVAQDAQPIKWFVLDAEAINDIDTTGAEALGQAIAELKQKGITFAVTRASAPVPELLETYELLEQIGEGRFYATNRDAVEAFRQEMGRPATFAVGSSSGR